MVIVLSIIVLLTVSVEPSQTTDPVSQLESVLELVTKAITNSPLAKEYELAFHTSRSIFAATSMATGRSTMPYSSSNVRPARSGLPSFTAGRPKVVMLGGGTRVEAGGDDFEWMDYWYVCPKGPVERGAGERTVPRLVGEALLVGRSESASGLIYWNGRRYVWYQPGD